MEADTGKTRHRCPYFHQISGSQLIGVTSLIRLTARHCWFALLLTGRISTVATVLVICPPMIWLVWLIFLLNCILASTVRRLHDYVVLHIMYWPSGTRHTEVHCGSPVEVLHTASSMSGDDRVGGKVMYTCIRGYERKSGSGFSRCQLSGVWTRPTLVCEGTSLSWCNQIHIFYNTECWQLTLPSISAVITK